MQRFNFAVNRDIYSSKHLRIIEVNSIVSSRSGLILSELNNNSNKFEAPSQYLIQSKNLLFSHTFLYRTPHANLPDI